MPLTVDQRNQLANTLRTIADKRALEKALNGEARRTKDAPSLAISVDMVRANPTLSPMPEQFMKVNDIPGHACQLVFGDGKGQVFNNFWEYAAAYMQIAGTADSALQGFVDTSAEDAYYQTLNRAAKVAMSEEVTYLKSESSGGTVAVRRLPVAIIAGLVGAFLLFGLFYEFIGYKIFGIGATMANPTFAIAAYSFLVIGFLLGFGIVGKGALSDRGKIQKRIKEIESSPDYNSDNVSNIHFLNEAIQKLAPLAEKVRNNRIQELSYSARKLANDYSVLANSIGLAASQYGSEYELAKIIEDGYAESIKDALVFREDRRWKQSQEALSARQLDEAKRAADAAEAASAAATAAAVSNAYIAYKVRNL